MRISIFGCGWLGLPLAIQLTGRYAVKGTARSSELVTELRQQGITPFIASATDKRVDVDTAFFECECLIITLPYRRQLEINYYYLKQLQHILTAIPDSLCPSIIFTSSTSVYPNDSQTWSEQKPILSFTERSKLLFETEQLIMSSRFPSAVIRLAGLFGPNRFPGRFFNGQTDIKGGNNPINLVHLDDCIGIIRHVIEHDGFGRIWNACCPDHPIKKNFYHSAAIFSGQPAPQFCLDDAPYKVVDGSAISNDLAYKYTFQSPADILVKS